MSPFNVMRNMDNKEVIEKVIMMTEKSRNRIKQTVEIFEKGEVVRISTHIQIAKNSDYVSFNQPVGLKKGIIKEKWLTKAIVLKIKINQCKVQIIENLSEREELVVHSIWSISKDALKKTN